MKNMSVIFFIFLGKKEIDSNIGGINSENQRLPKVITNSRNFTTCFFFLGFLEWSNLVTWAHLKIDSLNKDGNEEAAEEWPQDDYGVSAEDFKKNSNDTASQNWINIRVFLISFRVFRF